MLSIQQDLVFLTADLGNGNPATVATTIVNNLKGVKYGMLWYGCLPVYNENMRLTSSGSTWSSAPAAGAAILLPTASMSRLVPLAHSLIVMYACLRVFVALLC